MSSYECRYEVHSHRVSHYCNTPEEVLIALRARESRTGEADPNAWIAEGYADYKDMNDGRTMVTRRQIGPVLRSTIELLVARNEVANLIERLRSPDGQH